MFEFGCAAPEPGDVAVRAWLKDRAAVELKYAELFAARFARFEYFQCPTYPAPKMPDLTPERLRPLEEKLDEVFAAKGRGRGVKVLPCLHERECLFFVRRADPYRREGALDGTGEQETSVLYRPMRFDAVVYDFDTGTLRVHARPDWVTSLYRGQFGLHLFGRIDHFPGEDRYTLQPLRSGDRACLTCADVPPIKHVNLVEVQLRWGGIHDSLEVHKAADVLAALPATECRGPQDSANRCKRLRGRLPVRAVGRRISEGQFNVGARYEAIKLREQRLLAGILLLYCTVRHDLGQGTLRIPHNRKLRPITCAWA